jgi:hypothetical protein
VVRASGPGILQADNLVALAARFAIARSGGKKGRPTPTVLSSHLPSAARAQLVFLGNSPRPPSSSGRHSVFSNMASTCLRTLSTNAFFLAKCSAHRGFASVSDLARVLALG